MISYLVKINSVELPCLKGYTVEPNKLWTDAGRNMSGDLLATYVGMYPKVDLEFTYTNDTNLSIIAGLLLNATFTVSAYDPQTKGYFTGTYYAGDYKLPMFSQLRELYEPFTVNLIPFKKAQYE